MCVCVTECVCVCVCACVCAYKSNAKLAPVGQSIFPASIQVEMCELMFPFIMYDVLVNGGEDCRKLFSDSFRDFFTAACSAPLEDTRPVLLMVRTIMYLRTVPKSTGKKRSVLSGQFMSAVAPISVTSV